MSQSRAIDGWVNFSLKPSGPVPEYLKRVAEDTFKNSPDFFHEHTPEELIAVMDRAGVTKALLNVDAQEPDERVLAFPRAYPDRFFLAVLPDIRRGMSAVWAVEDLVRAHPVVTVRAVPMIFDLP